MKQTTTSSMQSQEPNLRIIRQSLTASDLPMLLSSDATIYPSPLTLSRLSSWVACAPELSCKYVMAATGAPTSTPSSSSFNTPLSQLHSGDRTVHMEELDLAGVVIILPILSPHWERLISGELKEWDITEKMLFRTSTFGNAAANTPGVKEKSRDTVTLGLHTWHIEKFPAWDRFNLSHPEEPSSSFGIYARDDADSFLLSLQRDLMPVKLEIVGSSALCVTSAGERLFGQRLGYTEGEYKGQVVVQEADETTKIMEAEGWDKKKAIGSTCRGNEKVVGKCRMLVKMNRRQEIEN